MIKVKFITADGRENTVGCDVGLSLMEAARANSIDAILADCGGAGACATCHVYVDPAWYGRLSQPDENERDMIDCAIEPRETSRLSCQIRLSPELDGLVVGLPVTQI